MPTDQCVRLQFFATRVLDSMRRGETSVNFKDYNSALDPTGDLLRDVPGYLTEREFIRDNEFAFFFNQASREYYWTVTCIPSMIQHPVMCRGSQVTAHSFLTAMACRMAAHINAAMRLGYLRYYVPQSILQWASLDASGLMSWLIAFMHKKEIFPDGVELLYHDDERYVSWFAVLDAGPTPVQSGAARAGDVCRRACAAVVALVNWAPHVNHLLLPIELRVRPEWREKLCAALHRFAPSIALTFHMDTDARLTWTAAPEPQSARVQIEHIPLPTLQEVARALEAHLRGVATDLTVTVSWSHT